MYASPERGDLGIIEDELDKTFEHDDDAPPPDTEGGEEEPGQDDEDNE